MQTKKLWRSRRLLMILNFECIGPTTNYHDVDNNNDDDDDAARMPSFGSAGGIGTPTSSRARMLAQQRDIQQKKRLSAYQSGGKETENRSTHLTRTK